MVNDVLPSSLDGRLPRYAPPLAELCRALCDTRAAHPGVASRLRPHGVCAVTFERALTLDLECAHGPLTVVANADDYPALESIALDTERDRASALANMWLADTLARFRTNEGGTPAIKAITLGRPADRKPGLALRFSSDGVDRTCFVTEVPAALCADYALTWTAGPHAAAENNSSLGDILLPGVLRLRSRQCSPDLLASLRRNDVLLGWRPASRFAEPGTIEQAQLRFGAARGRQLGATVRVDAHAITLETALTSVNDAHSDDASFHAGESDLLAGEIVDVAAMDLPVHIELLTVNLSVAQLGALQPGYVLDLPLPLADAPVRLAAYGQTLALGKLVAVGDNLGVQITRMAASDERQS
ncbi:type III secretion system cytoplasmic ring protein SctQ [Trinickia caryophylli]|uniref:Type III secretion protein Q n=1 Tax=Trinickia caryophylli TaxID=28094 RepID=A0A1X7D6I3_TRICW|nr:type III secretion system cytoplasmic ring protein SctQ [Trinickia caryophylli]WQE14947.1 type III secretion system cytoplasmic ring protein SctQ [Trinickia caryophylli]GLU31324.1 type III secretion-associated protein [Trinickia caryophylli]SMF09732.1 type III secretion protein Q [Trinickia caryophylli]